jgi:hypothetical protein
VAVAVLEAEASQEVIPGATHKVTQEVTLVVTLDREVEADLPFGTEEVEALPFGGLKINTETRPHYGLEGIKETIEMTGTGNEILEMLQGLGMLEMVKVHLSKIQEGLETREMQEAESLEITKKRTCVVGLGIRNPHWKRATRAHRKRNCWSRIYHPM